MPVPKGRRSHSRKHKRNANKNIAVHGVTRCQTCQETMIPHKVCESCGYYKGIKVLRTKSERLYERGKARQVRQPQESAPVEAAAE